MLSEVQLDLVWREMLDAEWRSLYYADLANAMTRRKQWIMGCILFLSSGAAVTAFAKQPAWLSSFLAMGVAGLTAYLISANLEGALATLQKLHSAWARIQNDYERLWSHTFDDDAELELGRIQERGRAASALGMTASYQGKRVAKWQEWVDRLHSTSYAA